MRARDLMISDVAFVTANADLAEVIRLLKDARAGAVPVVDDRRAPIGIVTRSDVLRAKDPYLGEAPPAWLVKGPRPLSLARPDRRPLRDVMSAPAVSVLQTDPLEEIVRIMEARRLKRLPVVDGRALVGLLWRPDVLRALDSGAAPEPCAGAASQLTAEAFRRLILAHEDDEARQRAEAERLRQEAEKQRIEELAKRKLTDGEWRELLARARQAAAAGAKEFMLIRFPARLCLDGGRAINAPDPGWPATLRGEPLDIFTRWRRELEPCGFRLAAQIVDFPHGVPGDAALFLIWAA